MALATWLCLLCSIIVPVKGVTNSTCPLKYQSVWARCSSQKPFLTFRGVGVQKCVSECQIRNDCKAVNYFGRKQNCRLLPLDTLPSSRSKYPCLFIRKIDIQQSPMLLPSACSDCGPQEVCDVQTGECNIKECREVTANNIMYRGNLLSVGSKIVVSCVKWFVPYGWQPSVCTDDGSWSYVPECVLMFECGIPPPFPHAEPIKPVTDEETWELVVLYKCDRGYTAPWPHNDMTMGCMDNGTWEQHQFECIRNCRSPPLIDNSTVTEGGNLENMTKTYSCLPGYALNETIPSILNTTCQANGLWTEVDFECLPVCGTPPVVANATAVGVTNGTDGIFLDYACDEGYIQSGNVSVPCMDDGTWPSPTFECLKVGCPLDWHRINMSCYYADEGNELNIVDSYTFCQSFHPGSYLQQLETEEEDISVRHYLATNYTAVASWCLGLKDIFQNNTWIWYATNTTLNYSHWADSEPQGGQYNAAIKSDHWRDQSSSQSCTPLCEISLW